MFSERNKCVDKLVNLDVDNKLDFFLGTLLCLLILVCIFSITYTNFLYYVFMLYSFSLYEFWFGLPYFIFFSFLMFHVMIDDW